MPITLPVQPDAPITHRGITVVPLFPRCNPGAEYTTLASAIGRGFRVAESSDEGSVPELVVTNPLADLVLLYDGEELIGAKQNRILNLTVLVAAESVTPIPVSCVEAGRWHRRSATFASGAHTAGPELRLRKARALGSRRDGARRRPERGVGRGRRAGPPPRRPLPHLRDGRHLHPPRAAARRAARGVPRPPRPVRHRPGGASRHAGPAGRSRVGGRRNRRGDFY